MQEYQLSINFQWHQFLVDINVEKIGRVLKLDSIKEADVWKSFDLLVFDSWHWWFYKPPAQPYDSIFSPTLIFSNLFIFYFD